MAETTGTDLVREALRGRNRKLNLAVMARNLNMSSERLDAFSEGRLALPPDIINAIVKELWNGHVVFDADADALTSANKAELTFSGIAPPPFDPASPQATQQ
jgi:hypothetical protein